MEAGQAPEAQTEGAEVVEIPLYDPWEDLPPLVAIDKYCTAENPLQRLSWAGAISATAETLSPEEVASSLAPLLKTLLSDAYADVRSAALRQVPAVAKRLAAGGVSHAPQLEALWDGLEPTLLDPDLENQEAAVVAAAELAHALAGASGAASAVARVAGSVERLVVPPDAVLREEGACQALALAVKALAPRDPPVPPSPLGPPELLPVVVPLFHEYVRHSSHDVREVVAAALPPFLQRLTPEQRTDFIPEALEVLANDSHWNVRAATAPMLLRLSSQIKDLTDGERQCLRRLMGQLLADTSPLVRVPALLAIGPFLLTLPPSEAEAPEPPLLAAFTSCARVSPALHAVRVPCSGGRGGAVWEGAQWSPADEGEGDGEYRAAGLELPVVCAHFFAKVLAHCGADTWPLLADTWDALTYLDGSDEALNCVIAGLPTVASVLSEARGEEYAQEELTPAAVRLVRTRLAVIAPALSGRLAAVAGALSPQGRLQLLAALPALALQQDRQHAGDWRRRLRVTQQLPALAATVTPQQAAHCLWPVLLALTRDPVATVRREAARQVGPLLPQLPESGVPGADGQGWRPEDLPGAANGGNGAAAGPGQQEGGGGGGSDGGDGGGGAFGFRAGLKSVFKNTVDMARDIPHVSKLVDAGTKVAGKVLEGIQQGVDRAGWGPQQEGGGGGGAAAAAAPPAPLVTEDEYAGRAVPPRAELLRALTEGLASGSARERRTLAAAACGLLLPSAGGGSGGEYGADVGGGRDQQHDLLHPHIPAPHIRLPHLHGHSKPADTPLAAAPNASADAASAASDPSSAAPEAAAAAAPPRAPTPPVSPVPPDCAEQLIAPLAAMASDADPGVRCQLARELARAGGAAAAEAAGDARLRDALEGALAALRADSCASVASLLGVQAPAPVAAAAAGGGGGGSA